MRLVFGTGNTCGMQRYTTADGAVALDMNGNVLWDFPAHAQSNDDYDTGSSTMISNGLAMFKNKDGVLYSLDAGTGALVRASTIDPNYGYGKFPSPTSDGQTIVIGWGLDPITSPAGLGAASAERTPQAREYARADVAKIENILRRRRHPMDALSGYHSALVGIDSVGSIIWTHRMTAVLDGYAAIAGGVVFADDDDALSAFDLHSGTRLWTYAYPSMPPPGAVFVPQSSPAVVPSGVYAADGNGNVYAFAIPH